MTPIIKNCSSWFSIILLFALKLTFISNLNAQVKVFSNENVQIGPYWGGTPSHNLFVNGSAHFNCYPATWGGFWIENYSYGGYNEPIIKPNNGHNLWIGNSDKPLWRVYTHRVVTYQGAGVLSYSSDSTLKTNVEELIEDSALSTILKMQAYKFDFKESFYKDVPEDKKQMLIDEGKDQRGFIAQELKDIYPQAVCFDESCGLYNIDYSTIIPILVEATKSQNATIVSQQETIDILIDQLLLLQDQVTTLINNGE